MRILQPTSVIKARLGIDAGGKAQKFFTETCYKYMSPFVPGGTKSHLNQNVALGKYTITYKSPSAHYLWTGIRFVDPKYKKGAFYSLDYGFWSRPGITKISSGEPLNYHTPGTGSHWDKRMWTSKGNEVIKQVQDYIDRGCK